MLRSARGKELSADTHLALSGQLFGAALFDLALEASTLGFERFGTGTFAYNAACSLAQLGKTDEGLEWLERAVSAGFDDAKAIHEDADLAPLREDGRFERIRAGFRQ
jgi:hypothetical protein